MARKLLLVIVYMIYLFDTLNNRNIPLSAESLEYISLSAFATHISSSDKKEPRPQNLKIGIDLAIPNRESETFYNVCPYSKAPAPIFNKP
jgi:hypothetical protein